MKTIRYKKTIITAIIIAIIGIGAFFIQSSKNKVEYATAKAEIGNLVQTISETGTIKTAKEISLNFLASGKIAKQYVKIGDRVQKDQILAELDFTNLKIQEKQSAASLQNAVANLAKTRNGATRQDIAINEATANQAQASYLNSLLDLDNTTNLNTEAIAQSQKILDDLIAGTDANITIQQQTINSAQSNLNNIQSTYQQAANNKREILLTTLDDKISVARTAVDAVNRVLSDGDAKDTLSIQDSTLILTTQNSLSDTNRSISSLSASIATAKSSKTDSSITVAVNAEISTLTKTLETLNNAFSMLGKTITGTNLSQTALDSLKTSINSQIILVNAAISAVQNNQQAYNDAILALNTNTSSAQQSLVQAKVAYNNAIQVAKNNLANIKLTAQQQTTAAKARVDSNYNNWQVAKAQLEKTASAPRNEDIKSAEAQVLQAEAALEAIRNQITNSVIKSPINGQVTKVNYEIGEEPKAASPVIAVLSEDKFEIDLDISEADIIKVKQLDPVNLTFDAFGDDVKFDADVIFIEPAQTVIQDVVYYKTTIGNIRAISDTKLPTDINMTQTATTSEFSTSTIMTASSTIYNLIKPGMTANAVITTAAKNNVLLVPSRAITEKTDKTKIVKILKNNKPEERLVTTGLKGDEGMTEIISGINAGDIVITSTKTAVK